MATSVRTLVCWPAGLFGHAVVFLLPNANYRIGGPLQFGYNLLKVSTRAKWLLIQYRVVPGDLIVPLGIALYIPDHEELHLEFRPHPLEDPTDNEFLAEMGGTLRNMVIEGGAARTFEWMSETLSLGLFVEGPYEVDTSNPQTTLTELYEQHCIV
jgi:hypothetical protein